MAKLTRTDAVAAAKKLAINDERIQALTIPEIDALGGYQEKRQFARERLIPAGVPAIDAQERHRGDVDEAFIGAALDVWGRKLQQLATARANWKRAITGLSEAEAQEKVVSLLKAINIRGMSFHQGHFGSWEVARSWGSRVTLYVRLDRDFDHEVVNPDDSNQRAGRYGVRVEVSWSSTTRSLSESELAMRVYRETLDAAHEIDAVMGREHVIWTWNVPSADAMPAEPQA